MRHSPSALWIRGAALLAIGLCGLALGSCDTQDIGQGYELRFADRGKTWIQNPDGTLADGETVLSVWSDDEVIIYQVRNDPPVDCDYRMIRKSDGVAGDISPEQAVEAVTTRAAKLQTSLSSSCPLGSTRR